MSQISDFLAWLGGADLEILRQALRDRGKYVQMGCVLLTTSSIAAVSMTFAIHNTMGVPVPVALIFGLFWGLIIINLDRFLVISMGSTRDLKRLIGIAIPRLLMAIVVSAVISTPITLEIFRSDIYATMTQMNLSQSTQIAKQEANSDLQLRANKLQGQITADEAILNGQIPATVTSPQLQTAQAQVNQLTTQVKSAYQAEVTAYEAYQCELYGYGTGCAGGSGKAGYGPIAQAKKTVYEQDLATYNSLNNQLKTAQGNLAAAQRSLRQSQAAALARYQKSARQELPGLRSQLAQLQAEIQQQNNYDQGTMAHNTGLLRQLSALYQASSGNSVLLLAHVTVAALFFLIELLPVVVKLLLNLGQPSTYEQILKAEDDKVIDAMRLDRLAERRRRERESDEERKKEDAASQARITQAVDMSKHQEALGLKANDYVAANMEEILDAALQRWGNQVQAMLSGDTTTPGHGQQPANDNQVNGQQPGYGQPSGQGQPPAYNQPTVTTTPLFPVPGDPGNGNGHQAADGTGFGAQGPGLNPNFGLPPAGDML